MIKRIIFFLISITLLFMSFIFLLEEENKLWMSQYDELVNSNEYNLDGTGKTNSKLRKSPHSTLRTISNSESIMQIPTEIFYNTSRLSEINNSILSRNFSKKINASDIYSKQNNNPDYIPFTLKVKDTKKSEMAEVGSMSLIFAINTGNRGNSAGQSGGGISSFYTSGNTDSQKRTGTFANTAGINADPGNGIYIDPLDPGMNADPGNASNLDPIPVTSDISFLFFCVALYILGRYKDFRH